MSVKKALDYITACFLYNRNHTAGVYMQKKKQV